MAEIQIKDEHKAQLAQAETVLGFLTQERAKAQAEVAQALAALQHIEQLGQREQDALAALIREHYGVELVPGTVVDTAKGTITVPEAGQDAPAIAATPVID